MMRRKSPIEIQPSRESFDMWRLSHSGGYLHIKPDGRTVFRFDSKEEYQDYLSLNELRSEFEKVQTVIERHFVKETVAK